MGIRKFWAVPDGSGGYDIGEGEFTVATVRHIKFQDGAKVARAYEMAMGEAFDPRATALLFRAAPDMLEALERAVETADTEQYEADWYAAARAAIHKAKGGLIR